MNAVKDRLKNKKSNIPIQDKLYKRYSNVRDIFGNNKIQYNKILRLNPDELELENIDINNIEIGKLKKIAQLIFHNKHCKNTFYNNCNEIIICNSGIDESIEKIYNNRTQRNLIKEHLLVFYKLDKIIEKATLVNQVDNLKKTINPDVEYWNYYICPLYINGIYYLLEFEVRSMKDGQNQYRIQRLKKINKTD